MNEKDTEAIKVLEKAFLKCKRLGMTFVGIDDELLCVTKTGMSNWLKACPSGYNDHANAVVRHNTKLNPDVPPYSYCPTANAYLYDTDIIADEGVRIMTCNSYIDSGGW